MSTETQTSFAWLNPCPLWLLLLILVASVAVSIWSYKKTPILPVAKRLLVAFRLATCLWIGLLLMGPSLTQSTSNTVSDQIIVLIDQSPSMLTNDVPLKNNLITRTKQLNLLLKTNSLPTPPTPENRTIKWYGYQGNAYKIKPQTGSNDSQIKHNQNRTDLLTSITQVIESNSNIPISAVVVFGDGRESTPTPPGLLATLQAFNTPVITIPLGSPSPISDVAIGSTNYAKKAYGNDPIPIVTQLESNGDITKLGDITIALVDKASGAELDSTTVPTTPPWINGSTRVTLTGTPTTPNTLDWELVVTTPQPDLVQINNKKSVRIDTTNKPIRVLYIENRPRWEYRYLKNLLMREQTILSSTLLLSADPNFAQEGDRAIRRLPSTEKEFQKWDILVLGDIPPTTINLNQASIINKLVSRGELSIVWVGGEQWNPTQWGNSQLEEFLPMFHPSLVRDSNEAFYIQPTGLGKELGIFHHNVADTTTDQDTYEFDTRDLMYWSQHISPSDLKPGVEILAVARNKHATTTPVILSMRVGLGTSLYIGTDECWRWRNGRGEKAYEQFWIQLIRSAQINNDSFLNKSIYIDIQQAELHVGTPVVFDIHIPTKFNIPADPKLIDVEIFDQTNRETTYIQLAKSTDTNMFTGTWIPKSPGTHNIHTQLNTTTPQEANLKFMVKDTSDEARSPESNHTHLLEISTATNGAHILPKNINSLQEHVPDRSTTTITSSTEPVWGLPWLYLPLGLFLCAEWVTRRYNGFV
jgi:hypothetical protein